MAVRTILLLWLALNLTLLVLFAALFARRVLRWHAISRLATLAGLALSALFGVLLLALG